MSPWGRSGGKARWFTGAGSGSTWFRGPPGEDIQWPRLGPHGAENTRVGTEPGPPPPSPRRGPSRGAAFSGPSTGSVGSGEQGARGLSFAPRVQIRLFLPPSVCVCVAGKRGLRAPTLATCQAPASGFGSRSSESLVVPGSPGPGIPAFVSAVPGCDDPVLGAPHPTPCGGPGRCAFPPGLKDLEIRKSLQGPPAG